MRDTSRPPPVPLRPLSFDGPLGRQIVELHMWVVREGLRGAAAAALFDGLCQRLVIAGVPLWRAVHRNADIASAVGRLQLHLAAGSQRH